MTNAGWRFAEGKSSIIVWQCALDVEKKYLYILLEIRVVVNNVDGMVNGGGCVVIGCAMCCERVLVVLLL